ncbi:MAG: hypothetical protein ACOYM0_10315 [Bacteroidales bacterium]
MKKILLYLLMMMPLTACVKQVSWDVTGGPQNLIAVDGILTSERKTHTIVINHPVSGLNDTAMPVSGATVIIHTTDSTWNLSEKPVGSGRYQTPSTFAAFLNKTYSLNIYSGSSVYSAKAEMVTGTTFSQLTYAQNEKDNLFHIEYVASAFSSSQPAMWEILLDWTRVPGYEHADPAKCKARLLFYTLPTLDVSEIFAPVMEQTSFPRGTTVTERRYSLAPPHAEFVREMLLETSWQGGLFPTAAANVSTNLSSGAVGFFGVCSVNELSIQVAK